MKFLKMRYIYLNKNLLYVLLCTVIVMVPSIYYFNLHKNFPAFNFEETSSDNFDLPSEMQKILLPVNIFVYFCSYLLIRLQFGLAC